VGSLGVSHTWAKSGLLQIYLVVTFGPIALQRATISKKGDRLRDKAEELRTNVDNIRAVECHRISLELAATADELADRWDAIDMTMAGYLGNRAAAK
jgi:hypothetical protein